MNPSTGELVAMKMPAGFEGLPAKLQRIAKLKIERAEAHGSPAKVNLRSRSPLAQWAKKKRLAKIAAQSRRRNRHGKR